MDPLLRSDLRELMAEHQIGVLALFGSRATDSAGARSDVDLAALRADRRRMSHRQLADLRLALADRSRAPVDLVDLASADTLLRFDIVSHGRLLGSTDRSLWIEFVARTLIDHDEIAPFIDDLVAGVGRVARKRAAP